KIQRLSPATQRVLTLAACIGSPFDVDTLAVVSQQSAEATAELVGRAVDEGLVVRASGGDGGYAFLHDRVQQAAYARLPDADRNSVHLAVGRLLLGRWDRGAAEERVFDIVGHLNIGRELIAAADQRLALARLNLPAG